MNHYSLVTPADTGHTRFGEVPHYSGGLYDLGHKHYAWLVPNGSWGESNAGLVIGDGESLLVDTLWDLDCTRTMLAAMAPLLDDAPLRYVVNTHADGDHWWGNQLVAGAEIITSQAAHDEVQHVQPRSMLLLGRVGRLLSALRFFGAARVGHWFQQMVAPYDFRAVTPTPATRTFHGELTLRVGGREVRLIEVGPAHTQGDLIVFVPGARTLYCGDILFVGCTPALWAGPLENWLSALDRILDMDVEILVPGHGPLAGRDEVHALQEYWEYVAVRVRRRFQSGVSATEAARDIALSPDFAQQSFAVWDSPERIMTNVHTIYRNLQGHSGPLTSLEMANILRQQALLAHELPGGRPAVMRQHLRKP